MLFLRVTPTLPNLFINLASPIVDIPFHIFFLATLLGLIPASYITVRVSFSTEFLASFVIFFLKLLIHVLAIVIAFPFKNLCCLLSYHHWIIIKTLTYIHQILYHMVVREEPFAAYH